MAHLARMFQMIDLRLGGWTSPLTDRGVEGLASPRRFQRCRAFPASRDLMPRDVTDEGFRHIGRCEKLEGL